MKKILTVSLFAIMAVGAANADIASTSYVDTRTGVMSDLATTDKANLVVAINEVKAGLTAQSTGNATAINDVKQQISDLDDSLTAAIATAKSEAISAAATDAAKYIDESELTASQNAQNTAIENAYKAADKVITDSIGTVEEGKTVVQMITEASTGADTALSTALADYSTTTQMNSAIATAKSEAATDAQSKADAAEAAAKAASDPKGSAAQALTDAKAFTTQEINALSALAKFPAACAQGVSHCSLTIKNGDLTWEIVQ